MIAQTPTRSGDAPVRRGFSAAVLVVAIVVLALNLRGPIVAVAAVLEPIRAGLGISAGTVGLLTSLPVLSFGLATPLASVLLARVGLARGVSISLIVLLVGIGVRSLDGLVAVLAGTVLIGLGITVANVAVPVVIGRDLPQWSGAVLGVYTAALNIGSVITLSFTVPIADLVGWRIALLAWGAPAVVGLAVWCYATRGTGRGQEGGPAEASARPADADESTADARAADDGAADDGAADDGAVDDGAVDDGAVDDGAVDERAVDERAVDERAVDERVWWHRPVVWGLTAGFAGQAFAYYGITAWLPLLLHDELGMASGSAALSSSIFQVAAIIGAFGVPVLLHVCPSPRIVVLIVVAAWVTLPLGLLFVPQLWAVWCSTAGAAQGGGLVVVFAIVVRRARDLAENRRMSALVQGGGYAVAAAGPTVVGAVHEATGSWTAPLLVVLAAIALLAVAATAAAGRPTDDGSAAAAT